LTRPFETDRRKLQADIVRDLKVGRATPVLFRGGDRMITSIKIPDRTCPGKIVSSIKEIQNDAWLCEQRKTHAPIHPDSSNCNAFAG
jgi:hypothetical protein